MIPHKDLEQLVQYYKGELTENALLNKAAKLAAQKHVLLANPQLPPALVNAQTKPLSQELIKLTKRIRQFPGGVGVGAPGAPPGEDEEEEAGDLVTGPVEQWLKRMIKGGPSAPKPTITPATREGAREPRPSTSRGDTRTRLQAIREQRKALEKKLAESGKGKGKGKGKGISREVQALKPLPGWEDWAKGKPPRRRRLQYDSE